MKKSFSIIIIILLLIIACYFVYDIMKNRNILENFESEIEETEETEETPQLVEENTNTSSELPSMSIEEENLNAKMEGETRHLMEEEENIMRMFGEEEQGSEEVSEELDNMVSETETEDMGKKIVNDMVSEERNSVLIEDEETSLSKPDTQRFRFNNPTPISINVSYNNKNSVNDSNVANDDIFTNSGGIETMGSGTANKQPTNQQNNQQKHPNTSVNSDYGKISWNTVSDYYIPGVTNVNQNYNSGKSENSNACPLMYNKPWSDFKSGDN